MKKLSTRQIFSQMLVKLRKSKDISRQQLADDLGVSVASIGYYETAKRVPDIEVLVKIADYFQVSCDELLKGVKSPDKNVYKDIWLSDKALNTLRELKKVEPINSYSQTSYVFDFFNFWLEHEDLFIDFMNYYYRAAIQFSIVHIFTDADIPDNVIELMCEILGHNSKSRTLRDNEFSYMLALELLKEYASAYNQEFHLTHDTSEWRDYEEWYSEIISNLWEASNNGKHNPKKE